jgi:competence protein ComEA
VHEERRVWIGILVVAALLMFFVGFKYADYRHAQTTADILLMEELVEEEESQKLASQEEEPPGTIMVHVSGAVENPGVFEMQEGERVFQVLEKAHLATDADTNQLNLAQTLTDQDKVVVPRVGEVLETSMTGTAGVIHVSSSTTGGNQVNINRASAGELAERLPGIGPVLAQRIVDYRERNGGFKSSEEITEVSGIGEKRYEQIKDLITVR